MLTTLRGSSLAQESKTGRLELAGKQGRFWTKSETFRWNFGCWRPIGT
jgi:hypothetical protein